MKESNINKIKNIKNIKKISLMDISITRLIAGSFIVAIIIGTLILMLPLSSSKGVWTNPVDALFTATTSICVTGLVTVTTAYHWSAFGKFVIMCLAQLGGLGVITVVVMLLSVTGKRVTLKERMLVSEAYNLGELSGMVYFVRRIVKGTIIVEIIGFICYAFVFVPQYDFKYGIFCALFNSVSSFCNAGMDILGENSLIPYVKNPIVNITTISLIILGGIGFPVWWDVIDTFKDGIKKGSPLRKIIAKLSLHTKAVVLATAFLIVVPAIIYFILEYSNPYTMGSFSLLEKMQASIFQSVTTRTAGFASVDQAKLNDASVLLTILLMFTGGSPAGTAGGMKTTTMLILVATVYCMAKGRSDTILFKRRVSEANVRSALCIVVLGLATAFISCMCILAVEEVSFEDVAFEVLSALGTAGLSRGITSDLTVFSKLVLVVTMYIGRIGPITMVVALLKRGRKNNVKYDYPEKYIIVG